jgi:hypothetical protein
MLTVAASATIGFTIIGSTAGALPLAAMISPMRGVMQEQGTPVLAPDALFTTTVGGLERTEAVREEINVTGQPFNKALRVKLGKAGKDSNETQLLAMTRTPVTQGDSLMASFYLRGSAPDGTANVILMFEKSTDPWTKSVTQRVSAPTDPKQWRRVVVPFTAGGTYAPGEAMLTLRLATKAQTVEIADLKLINYGTTKTRDALMDIAAQMAPLGPVNVAVDFRTVRQTMTGIGGNFAKGRFGMTEMNDTAGRVTLDTLNCTHARIGIPLQFGVDAPGGKYKDEGPNHGVFLLMQEMTKRKIPMVVSAWDAPKWMLSNPERDSGRIIPRERWPDAIDALAQFLVIARDKYGAKPDYISFNEADGGYQIKFTSAEIADFIKMAAPKFTASGIKIQWLTGDTASGRGLVNYARPLLEDKELAPYLGPISFHSWDALTASEADYAAIAALGKEFKKPIWCLEMGYDPQLWQVKPPVWDTWDNALKLGEAYWKTVRFAEASVLDYWEYQADYPLVDNSTGKPYPAFFVLKQFTETLAPRTRVVEARSDNDAVLVLAGTEVAAVRGTFSVLLLNTSGAGSVTLTDLPAGAKVTIKRSSRNEEMASVPGSFTVDKAGRLTVPIAPRSVLSLLGVR